jgi:hypothetical protein
MSWAKRYEKCKILFGKPERKVPRMRRWKNVPEKHAKTVCGGLHSTRHFLYNVRLTLL